jgi:hypothetical protein
MTSACLALRDPCRRVLDRLCARPEFSAQKYSLAVCDSKLASNEKLILLWLSIHASETGCIERPKSIRLASICQTSARSIQRYLAAARAAGWIVGNHLTIPSEVKS